MHHASPLCESQQLGAELSPNGWARQSPTFCESPDHPSSTSYAAFAGGDRHQAAAGRGDDIGGQVDRVGGEGDRCNGDDLLPLAI